MEAPPAQPQRRRHLQTLAVVAVTVALVGGGLAYLVWSRAYSLLELEGMMSRCPLLGDLCEFEPGQTVRVAGTVTRLDLVNTSLGSYAAIYLDDRQIPIMFPGDVRGYFDLGARTTLTLTIHTYTYNGIAFRGTEGYPYPGIALHLSPLFSAISRVAGIGLSPATSGPDSLTLRVATHRGEAFPLSLFPLALVDVQGPLYVGEAGYLGPGIRDEVEEWTPSGNGTSPGGWLSFRDVAGNGLLDIGDEITVHGNRASGPELDSRLLFVGNGSGILLGVYYWFETSAGMMAYADPEDAFGGADVVWSTVASTPGPPESVDRFRAVVAEGSSAAISGWRYFLFDGRGTSLGPAPMTPGLFLTSGTLRGAFTDADGDGRISIGDEVEFRGCTPRVTYNLQLNLDNGTGSQLTWVCGYGPITGAYPLVGFSSETRLNASAVTLDLRVAGGFPLEETRNITLRLSQNGTPILALDLSTGVSASASGVTVTYLPGGDPTLLDAGDRVRLDGLRPGRTYRVEAVYSPRSIVSGSWTVLN